MIKECTGLISREDLGRFSEEFLETLKRENVNSHNSLQRMLGESLTTTKGFIQLEARPSGRGIIPSETAHVMSYIIDGGIPIEVRMNPQSRYSKITVKSIDDIRGYVPFLYDGFGNCIQEIRFEFSFNEVKKHLRNLTRMGSK